MSLMYFDPHALAFKTLVKRVPKSAVPQTWTLELPDKRQIPKVNWFCHRTANVPAMKLAQDDVTVIRAAQTHSAWGPIIELQLLMLFALLHACKGLFNLAHGYLMLCRTRKGSKLLDEALPLIGDHPQLLHWWKNEFQRYSNAELGRARNKLLTFLSPFPFRYMFSQTDDAYDMHRVVDSENLLVNASTGGLAPEVTELAGRSLMRRVYSAAIARQDSDIDPSLWTPFNCFVDEAQYCTGSHFGLGDLARECRKVKFRIYLGCQARNQLSEKDRLALGEIGSHLAFGCSWEESVSLFRECRGKVNEKDFRHRRVGEGFALLGDEIASFRAPKLPKLVGEGHAEEIRDRSRRERCLPIDEAKELERDLWGDDLPEARRGLAEYDRW